MASWFENLGLRGKLAANFLASGGVLIVAIVFCLWQIREVGKDTEEISTNWLPSVQACGEIGQLRLRYRVRSLEYLLPGSAAEKEKIEASLKELDGLLTKALHDYEALISSAEEKAIQEEVSKAAIAYRQVVDDAIALTKAGRDEEAQQVRKTQWTKAANHLRDQTDALTKINRTGADQASTRAADNTRMAITGGLLALLVAVLLALLVSALIALHLSSRLQGVLGAARQIADGNLREELPRAGKDEVGALIGAMSDMQKSLRSALGETKHGGDAVLESSRELREAVHQIERSAAIQSEASAAIAASVEELTVSISIVSGNTSEAAKLATASDEQASRGNGAVGQLIERIGEVAQLVNGAAQQIRELHSESDKISKIVAVIKGIAEQTNLLALNAAIEAARAGEHGRGFAIVADEVRKLSEQTAMSTQEIASMVGSIQQSTGQVVVGIGRGVDLVDGSVVFARQAGDAIAQLQEMARRVSELISDVDSAVREQASASAEVARKVESIASQAEEASGIAHETAHAAASLSQTAADLQKIVERFRL
jgi:methyl-accepting chemotaxis protein